MALARKDAKTKAFERLVARWEKETGEKFDASDIQPTHLNLEPEDNVPLQVFNQVLQERARRKIN
jgi:hypothetical protein